MSDQHARLPLDINVKLHLAMHLCTCVELKAYRSVKILSLQLREKCAAHFQPTVPVVFHNVVHVSQHCSDTAFFT